MGVDPGDSFSEQPVLLQEAENLFVVGGDRERQPVKIAQNLGSGSKVATRNLADHEWMHQYVPVLECLAQSRAFLTEVIYPDRGVNQDHRAARCARWRGAASKSGCVPPKAANLRPISRAISASRPARMRAVFSLIPVRRPASSRRLSSMFNVVLI